MAVSAEQARELALALCGVSEAPHWDRTAFRTSRKMFATLGPAGEDVNLLFDPDLRDFYCERAPEAFTPVPGGWGARGATRCELSAVSLELLAAALQAAYQQALPRSAPRRPRLRNAAPAS
jgi:hypothetical protein